MSSLSSKPDIVVGIDLGMTCTGVAYSMGPDWPFPQAIQNWPSREANNLADKVATQISYDQQTGEVTAWGFLCDTRDVEVRTERWFKLYLDPVYRDRFPAAPAIQEARTWYKDYLACIYEATTTHLWEIHPRFMSKQIEFLFSVPTTWRDPAMIATTTKLIEEAGFGQGPNQVARISLTEAEAAAVITAQQQFVTGEVILVCDAGGGTTDVNVLKLVSTGRGQTELLPLTWVEGREIGSKLLDFKIQKLIEERLELIREDLSAEPKTIAEKMMESSRFESFKCNFGRKALEVPTLPLPIPDLNPGYHSPPAHIVNSKMIITREELQSAFDDQIGKISHLIDEQLRRLQTTHPREIISYLIMSGGLGSSPYVRERLRTHYEIEADTNTTNAREMKILLADKPQLAVVRGLVLARTQEIERDTAVYQELCCSQSFGIVCRELYNPTRHVGEDVIIDPRDKKKYAEHQIRWIITQGQRISATAGVSERLFYNISLGDESRPWKAHIAMSSQPARSLPKSLKEGGAKVVCSVETVFNPADMKRKNRHWYNRGAEHLRAEFDVRVIIGAADLRFEVWGKDGLRSKKHDKVKVQWDPPTSGVSSLDLQPDSSMYGS